MDQKIDLTTEKRDAFAKVFAVVDACGCGKLSRDDMMQALRLLNYNPTDEQLNTWLHTHGNYEFNYEDFVSFVTQVVSLHLQDNRKEELRDAFAVFDKSNTDFIDTQRFLDILTKFGNMKVEMDDAMTWIEHMDRRKDGKIRIAELEALFVTDEDIKTTLSEQKWEQV